MPLGELLQVLYRRLWIILLVAGTLVSATMAFNLTQSPNYEASITMLVGQERGISETPDDVVGLQQLTQTMAEGVYSRRVAEAVVDRENLPTSPEVFLGHLSVEPVPNTQLITVVYRDTDPDRAQRAANAVGEVFSERVSEVSRSANSITATVWDPAVTPSAPVSPDPIRNGLLALAAGLMLGVGLSFLLEYLDESWRSPEEAERVSGVPVYGIIPELEVGAGKWHGN